MTPAKAGKFNIYNYVADDEIRPAMCGVFHDGGNKVACDSHILVAVKAEYPAEYEGSVLLKDGSYVEYEETVYNEELKKSVTIKHRKAWVDKDGHNRTIYPKWRDIIPNLESAGYAPYKFDREKFYSWIDEKRTAHKAETGKGIKWSPNWICKVGTSGFKAELFAKFIEAMDFIGATEVYLHEDGRRAALAKGENGLVLLMPVMMEDRYEHVTI